MKATSCLNAQSEGEAFQIPSVNVTTVTDLMGPPHHEVGEDSNPHNRAQEGARKEFSGFLLDKVSDVKTQWRHLSYHC